MVRSLYDLGLFSSDRRKIGNAEVSPREMMSQIFEEKFGSDQPDVCILRVEAHELPPRRGLRDMLTRRTPEKKPRVLAFTMVDRYDPVTRMTAMMRTTAWPASIVTQMLASGAIHQRGGIRQEQDVPAELFLREIGRRGVRIEYSEEQ